MKDSSDRILIGGLAQLARAPALHAGGHRFDSDILHKTMPCDNLLSQDIVRKVIDNLSIAIRNRSLTY